jgi:hypothetical protein
MARPLVTPTGRTSTDLPPWMISTGALLMGPVHRCCECNTHNKWVLEMWFEAVRQTKQHVVDTESNSV